MGILLDSPSVGQSEVLETLRYQGALSSGVAIFRIGPMVAHRWVGDEDRQGSDPVLEADVLTVLGALQTAGLVTAHDELTGASVDLTGSPDASSRVVLTGLGRSTARHPRPRPHKLRT